MSDSSSSMVLYFSACWPEASTRSSAWKFMTLTTAFTFIVCLRLPDGR